MEDSRPAPGEIPSVPAVHQHDGRLGLLESRRPGPNAFSSAAQEEKVHRVRGNAFAQKEEKRRQEIEEAIRRRVSPPVGVHPAYRPRSQVFERQCPPNPITASLPLANERYGVASPVALGPDFLPPDAQRATPTLRGRIEQKAEERLRQLPFARDEDKIYTFMLTPKLESEEAVLSPTTLKKRVTFQQPIPEAEQEARLTSGASRAWSNVRSFLTRSPSSATATYSPASPAGANKTFALPRKAATLLGDSTTIDTPSRSLSTSKIRRLVSIRQSKGRRTSETQSHQQSPGNVDDSDLLEAKKELSTGHYENEEPMSHLTRHTISQYPMEQSPGTISSQQRRHTSIMPFGWGDGQRAREQPRQTTNIPSNHSRYERRSLPPTPPPKDTPPEMRRLPKSAANQQTNSGAQTQRTLCDHHLAKSSNDCHMSRIKSLHDRNDVDHTHTGLISEHGIASNYTASRLQLRGENISINSDDVAQFAENLGLHGYGHNGEHDDGIVNRRSGLVFEPSTPIDAYQEAQTTTSSPTIPTGIALSQGNVSSDNNSSSEKSQLTIDIMYPGLSHDPSFINRDAYRALSSPRESEHVTSQRTGERPCPNSQQGHIEHQPIQCMNDSLIRSDLFATPQDGGVMLSPVNYEQHPSAVPSPLLLQVERRASLVLASANQDPPNTEVQTLSENMTESQHSTQLAGIQHVIEETPTRPRRRIRPHNTSQPMRTTHSIFNNAPVLLPPRYNQTSMYHDPSRGASPTLPRDSSTGADNLQTTVQPSQTIGLGSEEVSNLIQRIEELLDSVNSLNNTLRPTLTPNELAAQLHQLLDELRYFASNDVEWGLRRWEARLRGIAQAEAEQQAELFERDMARAAGSPIQRNRARVQNNVSLTLGNDASVPRMTYQHTQPHTTNSLANTHPHNTDVRYAVDGDVRLTIRNLEHQVDRLKQQLTGTTHRVHDMEQYHMMQNQQHRNTRD